MSTPPPLEVINAIERGTSQIVRRVEFYEADGVTPWYSTGDISTEVSRLVDGTISVDSTRDERRTLDMTLLNDDKLLRPNADGGFWYDKVIKPFRGVKYPTAATAPLVAIVEVDTNGNAYQFQSLLVAQGFTRTEVRLDAADITDVMDYDIVISYSANSGSKKIQLLQDAYFAGKGVITINRSSGTGLLPFVTSERALTGAHEFGIAPMVGDNPFIGAFTTESNYTGGSSSRVPLTWDATAQEVSRYTSSTMGPYTSGLAAEDASGGRWLAMVINVVDNTRPQAVKFLKASLNWVRDYTPYRTWEIQMGEFVIDKIDEANFPHQMKVTGRDYTKKCLLSKFEKAASFDATTSLTTFIRAIAANAGITKFKLPAMQETLGSTISVERGTARWEILKQAADANNYEIFFDNQGYLVMRKYLDPSFSPVNSTFLTGPTGNLVSYERSVDDSRIYNHICVYGDPSDSDAAAMPYFGEAKNLDPSSPTHIRQPDEVSGLEDRLYTFASTFFTSNIQAQTLANSLLKIHALESYDLSFSSIYYPWLEAGEITLVLDPDALANDPTRFLVSSIDYPMALGPMSISAKRVTYVGDPNSSDVPDADEEEAA